MKKKKVAKGLCLLLALLMSLCVFTACDKGNGKGDDTTETQTSEKVTEAETEDLYDENGYLKDNLPETYDFDSDFNIYTWRDVKSWEWVDSDTTITDTLSQSLWKRQSVVQQRFGVTINLTYTNGSWEDRQSFIQTLANSVQNNMEEYDLVGQYTPAAGIGATQGLYQDLNSINYLDKEKPWWPQHISSTATIGDKLYFITGDITPTLIRNIHCMYVNFDYYRAYNLSQYADGRSIYDVVRDGDWTYELMMTMGVGVVSNEEGMYGIEIQDNVQADPFFYGAGFKLIENIDGILLVSEDLKKQTLVDYFDKVQKLFTGTYSDDVYLWDAYATTKNDLFKSNKAVFNVSPVSNSQYFTEKGIRFTVLPMPKLDSSQEDYYSCPVFWVTMYSVPVDAPDTEMSGMILEALGSEAYRNMSDEIYYNLFRFRYNSAGNADSAEMFDLVSDSVVFDTARLFADGLSNMFAKFRGGVSSTPLQSWSTIYSAYIDEWNAKIENLLAKLG